MVLKSASIGTCFVHTCIQHAALPLIRYMHADNTGVFRDIVERGKRKVLELDPAGRKIVEVTPPN